MNSKIKRTCAFFTFGCKVNQYETQLLREEFTANGFIETKNSPSFLIINGCTVTSRADKKCKSLIKSVSSKNPEVKIILTGCYAQNAESAKTKAEGVTCIIPQDKKASVFQVIESKFGNTLEDINSVHQPGHKVSSRGKGISEFSSHNRAFVKIQDGCDNFCSYCIVPHMRGAPRSRKPEDIFKEVKLLSEKGFKEIVLCGINLGTWGREFNPGLKVRDLISELNTIEGVKRLRLSSIELKHADERLIDCMGKGSKLCRHLHIPLQSGDSFILKSMHRDYTGAEYLERLSKIRSKIKDICFTTDIMVGFPGETDVHFNNTLDIVKRAGFTRVHVFPYSLRSGTQAAGMPNQIDARTKRRRRLILEETAAQASLSLRKGLLNSQLSVLFEKSDNDCCYGYSDTYIYVKVPTKRDLVNNIEKVKITSVNLTGTTAAI